MNRRAFISLVGGAAVSPFAARAQQPALPLIGMMSASSRGPLRQQIVAFQEGLKESGYVEGQNVAVEYRFADGQFDRLPALASDLVRRQVRIRDQSEHGKGAQHRGPAHIVGARRRDH
jgi:putative tryptophan/tyrosine transport system substrate-binding protein